MTELILEGKRYEISAPAFGKLRKIISAFNRMQIAGEDSLSAGDDTALVIGLLINKSIAEVDDMQISFKEMVDVLSKIPAICELVEIKKESSGEVLAVGTDSMVSTATL